MDRDRLGSPCLPGCLWGTGGLKPPSPGELPALPCTPNLLKGTQQVALSISKVRTEGCRDNLSLQGSSHGGGTHRCLAVPLTVMPQAPQSPKKQLEDSVRRQK